MMHVDQTPSKGVRTETSRAEGYCVQVIIGLVCKDTEQAQLYLQMTL